MLVLDNIFFYYSDRIEQLCSEAGVKLVFLSLYFLDLNSIEDLFAVLKAFI